MKKIIAASAGLLLIGSMVSAASAEVTFTGDARERFLLQEKYNSNKNQEDYGYGRVRLLMNATAKGGAYANVRMIFGNNQAYSDLGTPPGTGLGTGSDAVAGGNGKNIMNYATDWAYMGIPLGPVTILAGRMPDTSDLWFRFDKRVDGVAAVYANKMTSVTLMADKILENNEWPTQSATTTQDSDINQYAAILKQKFSADWDMLAYLIYQDDQVHDANKIGGDGLKGTAKVTGPAGPVKLQAELSGAAKNLADYSNAGVAQNATSKYSENNMAPTWKNGALKYDNGYGGNVHAKMSFGPADATWVGGFTKNGFQADANYGFLMMGGGMGGATPDIPGVGSPITALSRIGQNPTNATLSSDTMFTGLIGDYQASKMIKLVGILAYADVKNYGGLLEVSGLVNFAVTDGAYINLGAGLLNKSLSKKLNDPMYNPVATATYVDDHKKMAYGAFTELGVKF
jgi:hypothetical protein